MQGNELTPHLAVEDGDFVSRQQQPGSSAFLGNLNHKKRKSRKFVTTLINPGIIGCPTCNVYEKTRNKPNLQCMRENTEIERQTSCTTCGE